MEKVQVSLWVLRVAAFSFHEPLATVLLYAGIQEFPTRQRVARCGVIKRW